MGEDARTRVPGKKNPIAQEPTHRRNFPSIPTILGYVRVSVFFCVYVSMCVCDVSYVLVNLQSKNI